MEARWAAGGMEAPEGMGTEARAVVRVMVARAAARVVVAKAAAKAAAKGGALEAFVADILGPGSTRRRRGNCDRSLRCEACLDRCR